MTSLRIEGVGAVRVGRTPVSVPELAVAAPGLVRLIGRNGSGKSTVVEVMAGGIRPRRGVVEIDGHVAHARTARSLRTVTRSEPALLPATTLASHARLFARAGGMPSAIVLDALEAAGLGECLSARADELSTGQLRTAWNALTTTREAPIRILDEPFLGIDAAGARRLVAAIERWASTGLVVLVDHEARAIAATSIDVTMEDGA